MRWRTEEEAKKRKTKEAASVKHVTVFAQVLTSPPVKGHKKFKMLLPSLCCAKKKSNLPNITEINKVV